GRAVQGAAFRSQSTTVGVGSNPTLVNYSSLPCPVRRGQMESRNRIDSSRCRIPFATVAGDGWYNEQLDLRWSV
ncbi:hypothetical protein M514_10177, partial [Trichuris suis]